MINAIFPSWEQLGMSSKTDASGDELKIPREQKAAVYDEHGGPIRIATLPVPEVENDELLVSICYSGVCRMDLNAWQGTLPWKSRPLPLTGGHEGIGVVVKVGESATNFKVGDWAGIKWINGTCMTCEWCKKGHESNCPGVLLSGFSRDGTFCQYTTVKAMNAVPIPENIENKAMATAILCEGLMIYRALKETNVQPGQFIAIPGAGGKLGRLAIQFAKVLGMRVLAIDRQPKEQICRDLGAELFVYPFQNEDLFAEIIRITDGGPHGVLNCAPVVATIEQAVEYVRPRGTVVATSMPTGQFNVDSASLVMKSICIKGSYSGNRQDADEAMDFFARGLIKCPVEIVPLNELGNVYERMRNNQVDAHVVLDLHDCD